MSYLPISINLIAGFDVHPIGMVGVDHNLHVHPCLITLLLSDWSLTILYNSNYCCLCSFCIYN